MHEKRAAGLEHEEPNSLRKPSGQATGVEDFAAGDEQAHGPADRNVRFGHDPRRAQRGGFQPASGAGYYVRESGSGSSRAMPPPGPIGRGRRGSRTQALGGGSSRRKSPQRCSVRRKRKTATMRLNTF